MANMDIRIKQLIKEWVEKIEKVNRGELNAELVAIECAEMENTIWVQRMQIRGLEDRLSKNRTVEPPRKLRPPPRSFMDTSAASK